MRLLDAYAIQCGATIDRPFILENYFPLPLEKFITFQAQAKYEGKDYDYWQAVINLVAPVLLKEGIQICQIGGTNELAYQRVIDLRGQTSISQLSYLIKRAMLHFGPDSFATHLCSYFDNPLVALYSVSSTEVSGPHFGDPKKQILFKGYERVANKKPSFAAQEKPKSINSIKPEEIADAIFKLLNINFVTPFKTIYIGPRYSSRMIRELVPDMDMALPNPEIPVEIRMDLNHDEGQLTKHLSYLQRSVVVTTKPIDLNLLRNFKPHITTLVYRIEENDHPNFIKDAISLGLPLILTTRLTPEQIEPKKINYYEFGTIHALNTPSSETIENLKKDVSQLYYHSCKLMISKGQMFPSHAAQEKNLPLQNDFEYSKVIDSETFWEDLDFHTIIKKH
jgi:hypothetical protein